MTEKNKDLTFLVIWLNLQIEAKKPLPKRTKPMEKPRTHLMEPHQRAKYEALAGILKALAHPTRLFIVDQLARCGPRCVCELTEMVGADISTVSRHLALLKKEGLVSTTKQGTMIYYQLRLPCVVNFLECLHSVLSSNIQDRLKLLS
jgi:DNA-binding transcriptional ArsR family regulator